MMKSRFVGQLAVALLAIACAFTGTTSAFAQASTGQIKGVVADASGAVIPGAHVTVVSLDTGFTRDAVSGGDGSFLVPLLPPGHYQIQVLAANFERLVRGPITVQVTETADLGNVAMTIGAQTATITVTGEEAQLQTENATLGKVFDSTLIEALPLSTRNFTQLLSLQAGVIGSIPSTLQFGNGTSQFSVGGGRVYDNEVSIDGVNAMSSSSSQSFSVPSPDSLDEFKMQTSTYSAEYGRAGSGNIEVTTKSGTNHYHGDGFYFFRNKALDANSYFNKLGEIETNEPNVAPDIRQNQWGGTVGGPIKRDKMFFFFSFQSTNQLNGNAGTVNDEAYMLIPAGDRSNTGLLAQNLGAIYGGQTGIFGGEAVANDGSNINPVSLAILQAKFPNGQYILPSFPALNVVGSGQKNDISYAHFSLLPSYTEKQYMGNVDYKLTPRQTLTEKYFNAHTNTVSLSGTLPGFTSQAPSVSENASITHNFNLSPTLVNEVKLGYLRQNGGSVFVNPPGFTASSVGMTPTIDGADIFPQYVMAANGIVIQGRGFSVSTENQYSISDVVSKSHGRHNMRFGGIAMDHQLELNSAGTWGSGAIIIFQTADFLLGLDGAPESQGGNGSGLSNLLLTAANSGTFQKNYRFKDLGYFFQDDFKIFPNLTLNLGLRWDYYAWPTETKGRQDNFVRDLIGEGLFGIPTPDQVYTGYTVTKQFQKNNPSFYIPMGVTTVNAQDGLNSNYNNYAPRVGFAWVPYQGSKTTSIRGGFGLFYSRVSTVLAQTLISGPPFNNSDLYSFGTDGSQQDPFSHLDLPPDSAFPIWTPRNYSPSVTPSLLFNCVAPHLGNPYTEQWNLNIQQQIAKDFLFELAYQGQNGVKLLQALSQNQAEIASPQHPIRGITTNNSTGINIQDRSPVAGMLSDEGLAVSQTTASSHFNALEATLNKRFSHGLQFLSAFTWSRDMDSNTVGLGAAGSGAVPPNDNTTTHHMSISGLDRTARFTTSAVYNLPKFVSDENSFFGHFADGWGMAGNLTAQTGPPIGFGLSATTTTTSDIKLQGSLTASLAPGKTLSDVAGHGKAKDRLNNYFNTPGVGDGTNASICDPIPGESSALACPDPEGFGNTPTNTWLRQPGQKSVDFSLTKTTHVYERYNVEIRADFFNFFNWVNFAGPDAGIIDSTFGRIQGTTVDPRVIQASAKVKF